MTLCCSIFKHVAPQRFDCVTMALQPILRQHALAYFRIAEEGITKRGVVMTLAEREQLCQRLLQYAETIGKPSSKVKALNRVRQALDKLKNERLQQNFANEARLNEVNLHNVQTMIGMLENMQDRLRVQTILNENNQAQVANDQVAQLSKDIDDALPSDKENDIPYDSVAQEALDADEKAAEWAKTARSSSDPPPEADQINQMLEEEAEKRQQRQSRKRKTFIMDRLQTAPDPAPAKSDSSSDDSSSDKAGRRGRPRKRARKRPSKEQSKERSKKQSKGQSKGQINKQSKGQRGQATKRKRPRKGAKNQRHCERDRDCARGA